MLDADVLSGSPYQNILRELHAEVREELRSSHDFHFTCDIDRIIDDAIRDYRHANRSLYDPKRARLIAVLAVKNIFLDLERSFKDWRRRRGIYRELVQKVFDDDRFRYLAPLLEDRSRHQRDAILLIGVGGLTPDQAKTLALHSDPDYPGLQREIMGVKRDRDVIEGN